MVQHDIKDIRGSNPPTQVSAPKPTSLVLGLGLILIGMVALMAVLLRHLHLHH